ncbi:hypothetical protein [Nocardia altamirensis]|uniref:hypothetical protein n=1 Tax=Nocardia altamirensis TaxID=472158 RepID=UPI000840031E|nr:hypothetical protein [Nocardia altamirensis]
MTVHTTPFTMISDKTPEWAFREPGSVAGWRLSWLPEHTLTEVQARAGMELDELLSDPAATQDSRTQSVIETCAEVVGIRWEQAVVLLAKRIAARLNQGRSAQGDPVPRGQARSHPLRKHVVEPPFVH